MRLDEARRAGKTAWESGGDSGGPVRGTVDRVLRFGWLLYGAIFLGSLGITWGTAGVAGPRRLWLALPGFVSAHSSMDLRSAIIAVTATAVVLMAAAALLRVWGRAALGGKGEFDAEGRRAEGLNGVPYRVLRAPSVAGNFLHMLGLCVLLSWGGALFQMLAVLALVIAGRFGDPDGGARAEGKPVRMPWARALLREIYFCGVAITFAVFGWGYNATVIFQGILVSAGLALLVQGMG